MDLKDVYIEGYNGYLAKQIKILSLLWNVNERYAQLTMNA